ncbi:transmembrane protein, putative [Medicago truncatula]|uniref:Transmembrane protein, putative n=1 Tax=Medicago truncatula TaxID=3880 RepID=G7LB08_MEDTR|nr:transmembrane protein, putative [Medicago truncatula]
MTQNFSMENLLNVRKGKNHETFGRNKPKLPYMHENTCHFPFMQITNCPLQCMHHTKCPLHAPQHVSLIHYTMCTPCILLLFITCNLPFCQMYVGHVAMAGPIIISLKK